VNTTRTIAFVLIASSLVWLTGCASSPERATPGSTTSGAPSGDTTYDLASKTAIPADRVTLHVNGLSCPLCASNVNRQIGALGGVTSTEVNFERGTIELSLTDPRPSPFALERAIDRAGFTLVGIEPR
jgi:copper chaperone CopZ